MEGAPSPDCVDAAMAGVLKAHSTALLRAAAAQRRVQARCCMKDPERADCSVVQPAVQDLVPGTGSTAGAAILKALMPSKHAAGQDCGQRTQTGIGSKFRFRTQSGAVKAATGAESPEPVSGAFRVGRALAVGLPVRVCSDVEAVRRWCDFHRVARSGLSGSLVRVADVRGDLIQVEAVDDSGKECLPVQ
eukprot:5659954-Amphidinium_carterae.1